MKKIVLESGADVVTALDLVSEEVENASKRIREMGGDDLKAGALGSAEKAIAYARKLAEFAQKVKALGTEWQRLKGEFEGVEQKVQESSAKRTLENGSRKISALSQKKEQSGNFPYPVGKLVKVGFPELFKRKLVNAGDVAYLLSDKASADFKTRGYPVIRIDIGEDDPGLYSCDHRRYYKMPPMVSGSKRYHLSSQFFPESREPVLKWLFARGLKKYDLIALCENNK